VTLAIGVAIWALTVFSRFKFNGLIFGLDYGLFHPDGSLYTFKTLTLMGYSQHDAATLVADWYSRNSFKLKEINPQSLYFDQNPSWSIYGTRFVYPTLSIPFVSLLGINGMLAVPALSYLVLILGILYLGSKYDKQFSSLFLVFILCTSLTLNRWMLINSTDSLLVAFTTVFVILYSGNLKVRYWIPSVILIVTAASFTRFSLLLWLGFAIILFCNGEKLKGLVVSCTSIICFTPTLFQNFQPAILPNEGNGSLLSKVASLPSSMFRIAFFDIAQLAIMDRILLGLIICATLIAIKNWRSQSAISFLIALFMLWITSGINGTPGVNFRYELPIIPLLAWVILENWKNVFKLILFDKQT
jgi:hypothetical protein